METSLMLKSFLSLLFVLGLVSLTAYLFRKYLGQFQGMVRAKSIRKESSLAIEEMLAVDARRRMVVLAHGKRRYVVLLGQESEVLLDSYEVSDDKTTSKKKPS